MSVSFKIIFASIAAMILSAGLVAQESPEILFQKIPRTPESDSISFGISLPESYSSDSSTYPVVYFLHGLNESYGDWKARWMTDFFHQQALRKKIPEVIMIFPDGAKGFWGDHYDGDPGLETDIIDHLIPYIDRSYPTQDQKRLIMGWSAGGAGAIFCYTKNPGVLDGAVSMDGAIITWDELQTFHPDIANQITNSDSAYYYEHFSPYTWAVRNREYLIQKEEPSIFLAASFFADYHTRFLSILDDQGIPVKYIALDCGHDFSCVMSRASNELLLFLSQIL